MTHHITFHAVLVILLASGISTLASAREYGDIYMDSQRESMQKAQVKAVVFPHWFHRIRFKCKVCHESIFVMKKGANNVSMRRIMDGEACGTCHNGVIAWAPLECNKCHSAQFETINATDSVKTR